MSGNDELARYLKETLQRVHGKESDIEALRRGITNFNDAVYYAEKDKATIKIACEALRELQEDLPKSTPQWIRKTLCDLTQILER